MIRSLKGLFHLAGAIVANIWFGFPGKSLTVIGVTGTDGKTTTATLIYEILRAAGHKISMVTSVQAVIAGKSYDTGFHVTTPSAFWVQKFLRESADCGDTHFVLEVTSHGLDQFRVWGIPFAVGVVTNVTPEHLDWHGTLESYRQTKLSLLAQSAMAIVNGDDEVLTKLAKRTGPTKRLVTFGLKKKVDISRQNFPFTTKLPGDFNLYNCLAAIAVAFALGVEKKVMVSVIADFSGVPGRMEIIQEKPFRMIVDFAHTPNALKEVLTTVKKSTQGDLIHIFGCAGLRDRQKRPQMGALSSAYADQIILTEEDYRTEDVNSIIDQIAKGIANGTRVTKQSNREKAIALGIAKAKVGDTLLLTGKGHEKSLCRGKVEYPWSDQQMAQKYLSLYAKKK